jgi:superfamily II RNA helicase
MERIQSITGFPLDDFQQRSLAVIEKGDDLLCTCPTGSGKTVVALTAIVLQALDKGGRAILTTPVKALSNQKYKECDQWLSSIGLEKRITLLTGDIQARATAQGGDGQPELLIMTSEILANKLDTSRRTGTLDGDLVNVRILVMDEAHYINDPERGHVWERTIMYLPSDIQVVALSATLSQPERFCDWLSKRRPTQLIQRFDRHVPLHIGGYNEKSKFIELFSTHGKKSIDSQLYKSITVQNGTFVSSMNKLVMTLEKDQKLPAIVFCMSKHRCEQAADGLSVPLLFGSTPIFQKGQDQDEFNETVDEHQYKVKCIRQRQDELYKMYLFPYQSMLSVLPGFETFIQLLDKGIAYHHAGMIPILREYVEILFAEKLIRVVFATETLAIGINMPARSVVFTQLDKPTGSNETQMLRPDQFWQMAGRAGRRGMDEKGFVVYYPIRQAVSESEFRSLLFSSMPSATSQLSIHPVFVLKSSLVSLSKSFLQHQVDRYILSLEQQLAVLPEVDVVVTEHVKQFLALREKMEIQGIQINPKQRKQIEKEIQLLSLDEHVIKLETNRLRLKKEIHMEQSRLQREWEQHVQWLESYEYMKEGVLTKKGLVTAGLSDGFPLIRGAMLAEGVLKHATFEEIVGWLGCFTDSIHIDQPIRFTDSGMNAIWDAVEQEASYYQEATNAIHYDTGSLLYLWAKRKDMTEICTYLDSGQLGIFVRCVLRVISYVEEVKTILLGIQDYELYNRLEHSQDRLMDGIVTNSSLYIR